MSNDRNRRARQMADEARAEAMRKVHKMQPREGPIADFVKKMFARLLPSERLLILKDYCVKCCYPTAECKCSKDV